MAVGGEDDGLVEAVELGLALGERAVDVGSRDLAACRDGVVIGPAPARDLGSNSALRVDVLAERDPEDRDVRIQVVESNPDGLRARVYVRAVLYVIAHPCAVDEL